MPTGGGEAVGGKKVYEYIQSFFTLHIQYGVRLQLRDVYTVDNTAWEWLEEFYEREKKPK